MEKHCKSDEDAYFWATHSGAKVDLFWQHEGKNWACEFKFADAPTLTKSDVIGIGQSAIRKYMDYLSWKNELSDP